MCVCVFNLFLKKSSKADESLIEILEFAAFEGGNLFNFEKS